MEGIGIARCTICGKSESDTVMAWGWGTCDTCHARYCSECKSGLKTSWGGFGSRKCIRCKGNVS